MNRPVVERSAGRQARRQDRGPQAAPGLRRRGRVEPLGLAEPAWSEDYANNDEGRQDHHRRQRSESLAFGQAVRMASRSGTYPPGSTLLWTACLPPRSTIPSGRAPSATTLRHHRRHRLPAPGALEGPAPGRGHLLYHRRDAGQSLALIVLALAAPCAISTYRTSSALHQARA